MEKILSTEQRIKILEGVIFKTDSISVNSVANQLKLSKGFVSRYFSVLVKENILKKTAGKLHIVDSSLVNGLKILLNLRSINPRIFKKYAFVKSVGLYGSCAKGENTEESDVDLWIKVEKSSEEDLASLSSALNKKIKGAKILFLTDEKIKKIAEEDALFYHSLVFGSIILYGDKDGIQI